MAESSKEDRHLPATARRLEKAAQDGQVARSRDIGHALAIGTATLCAGLTAPGLYRDILIIIERSLRFAPAELARPAAMVERLTGSIQEGVLAVLPTACVFFTIAILGGLVPGGPNLSWKAMGMKFSRLNPISGFGRIFSKDSLVNCLKLLALAVAIGLAAWQFTDGSLERFAGLAGLPLHAAVSRGVQTLSSGLAVLAIVLFCVALFDVPWQWFSHRSKLKMSFKEVRDENKETEGDPHVKGRLKQRQRELGRARMLAEVPQADVIVTNPTHYAVAIRYDETRMGAPRVVAKGVDHLALKIRELGRAHGVTEVELPPLARALYAHVELDHEVPGALYSAVAQVLAYVYQLRHFVPGRGRMPQAPSQVEVPLDLDPLGGTQ